MSSDTFIIQLVDPVSGEVPAGVPQGVFFSNGSSADTLAEFFFNNHENIKGKGLVIRTSLERKPTTSTRQQVVPLPFASATPPSAPVTPPLPSTSVTPPPAYHHQSAIMTSGPHSQATPVPPTHGQSSTQLPHQKSSAQQTPVYHGRGRRPERGTPSRGLGRHTNLGHTLQVSDSSDLDPTESHFDRAPIPRPRPPGFTEALRKALNVSPSPSVSRTPSPGRVVDEAERYFEFFDNFDALRAEAIKLFRRTNGESDDELEMFYNAFTRGITGGVHHQPNLTPEPLDLTQLVDKLSEADRSEVQRALLNSVYLALRQSIRILRNVIVQHTKIAIGRYKAKNKQKYLFDTFGPFFALCKSTLISTMGYGPDYVLTGDDYITLNDFVIDYFVHRLERIRARMKLKHGELPPAWNRILTKPFMTWIMDINNVLQDEGNKAAHPTSIKVILESLKEYMTDVPVSTDLKEMLEAMHGVLPCAAAWDARNAEYELVEV
ncbi:hypothetical protein SCHPADRAFT_943787 [Schizopora paradoxa]|uniref:Uncharacterized protein n=1 Tax=Schizopora paradoxa TaxID=27342 RepID=A0A0H2RBM3_9AGAM|nr:hypothetical protein SCHPADRAFT_943787 [Schizopora paradoxa]